VVKVTVKFGDANPFHRGPFLSGDDGTRSVKRTVIQRAVRRHAKKENRVAANGLDWYSSLCAVRALHVGREWIIFLDRFKVFWTFRVRKRRLATLLGVQQVNEHRRYPLTAAFRRRIDLVVKVIVVRIVLLTSIVRNERILFTNAGRKSVLRTPKHVCSSTMERPRGERP